MEIDKKCQQWATKVKNYEVNEMSKGQLSPLDVGLFNDIFYFLSREVTSKDASEKKDEWNKKAYDFNVRIQRYKLQEQVENQYSPMEANFLMYLQQFLTEELKIGLEKC